MLPQGSQGAAGRAERSAARVGEGSAPDWVVLEGAGLAAGAEVRVGRRFHGRHAGVIGVQVGVIHLIHGGQPVQTPVCKHGEELNSDSERLQGGFSRQVAGDVIQNSGGCAEWFCLSSMSTGCENDLSKNSCQLSALRGCFSFFT